jgi:hypothetical protein
MNSGGQTGLYSKRQRSFLEKSIRRARQEETIDMSYASLRTVFLAVCVSSFVFGGESKWQEAAPKTSRKAVVVELFTSEGCSTCPPAEALLAKLEARQPVEGAYVIALEEHVDYWNQQGWIDSYSSAEWTLRQQEYVAKFKENGVYTPQMIVDGQRQFVGSRELEAEQAIQEAANGTKTDVAITAEEPASDGIQQFKVRVGKLIGNTDRDTAEVWLAVTEKGLESAVRGGENAGRDLHHASVLRTLRKIGVVTAGGESSFAFEASPRVKFKSAWKQQNLQVAVFVQEKKSWRILGAASVGVAN